MNVRKFKSLLLVIVLPAAVGLLSCGRNSVSSDATGNNLHIQIVSGNHTMGVVDSELTVDYLVKVTDQKGSPVRNAEVSFEIATGDGTLSDAKSKTNILGLAKTRLHGGATTGTYGTWATVGGKDSVEFESFLVHPVVITSVSKGSDFISVSWTHERSEGFTDFSVYRRDSTSYGDSVLVEQTTDTSIAGLRL